MHAYLSQRTHLRVTGGQQHEALQHTLQQQHGDTWQREHLCLTGLQRTGLHDKRAGLLYLAGDSDLELSLTGVCLAGLSLSGLDDLRGLEARGLALIGDEDLQGLQQHGEA